LVKIACKATKQNPEDIKLPNQMLQNVTTPSDGISDAINKLLNTNGKLQTNRKLSTINRFCNEEEANNELINFLIRKSFQNIYTISLQLLKHCQLEH
jgi:hypothetical protein